MPGTSSMSRNAEPAPPFPERGSEGDKRQRLALELFSGDKRCCQLADLRACKLQLDISGLWLRWGHSVACRKVQEGRDSECQSIG